LKDVCIIKLLYYKMYCCLSKNSILFHKPEALSTVIEGQWEDRSSYIGLLLTTHLTFLQDSIKLFMKNVVVKCGVESIFTRILRINSLSLSANFTLQIMRSQDKHSCTQVSFEKVGCHDSNVKPPDKCKSVGASVTDQGHDYWHTDTTVTHGI
jgi:hypothetical protein